MLPSANPITETEIGMIYPAISIGQFDQADLQQAASMTTWNNTSETEIVHMQRSITPLID